MSAPEPTPLRFAQFVEDLFALVGADPPGTVGPYTGLFDELELDSLHIFQVVIVTEGLAGTVVPPPALPEMYTVGDLYDYYLALVRGDSFGDGW